MSAGMIDATDKGVRRACRAALCIVVVAALGSISGATAGAATTAPATPTVSVPASARVEGSTPTQAPASTTQAPATATPASGSQPGTVPPATSAPATTVPPTTTTAPPTTTTVPPTATSTTPTTAAPVTPGSTSSTTVVGVAHKAAPKNTRLSTLALALAVLGALLALGCIVWVVGRWLALEPRWTISLMHSLREASYRGSATWAEFTDWARIGR